MQVFDQGFLERAFDNEVFFGISLIVFWEDKTFLPSKTLCLKFVPKSPIYKPLMAIHKSNEKMWLLADFWKLSTGNRLQCLCNRLHNYNLKGHDFWIWISKVSLQVIDYRHMVIDYMLKIQIQNLFQQLFFILPF